MRSFFIRIILFYLHFFARVALFIHRPYVIGIGGTVGKSSTRNALFSMLKDNFPTKMVAGNSETGVPIGILGIRQEGFSMFEWLSVLLKVPLGIFNLVGCKYLIVEMGIDDPNPPKNMSYLLTIIKPDIAISLNVSAMHTMQFEKLLPPDFPKEERLDFLLIKLAEEDTKIITASSCRVGIYNADDKYISKQIKLFEKKNKTTKLLSFGKSLGNDIRYEGYKVSLSGTEFIFDVKNEKIALKFENTLMPEEYREVYASVILTGMTLGVPFSLMKQSLEKNFFLPYGRASILDGIKNSIIIDSSYNASKVAVLAFLSLIKKLKEQTHSEVVFLFGDMREIGEAEKEEHIVVPKSLAGVVDYLYCIGPLTQKYVIPNLNPAFFKEVVWFGSALELGKYVKNNLPAKSIILAKSSQNTLFMEEAVKMLLKNKEDEKKLCRQEPFWLAKKKAYFASLR